MSYDLNRSYLTIPGNLPAVDADQSNDGTLSLENDINPGNPIEHNRPDAATERNAAEGTSGAPA